ncbi:phasin family protein [Hoeflea prorocentri]|uniref:Phasin family protein n=1 Tax=Hoeflea prorocentri TaxID=1922333 RepID=A0A9X3UHA1_9HYPH|nr:phasin family protein [Hoeflea prorocentri]MCY6380662.1 phasin family protein [Hoeflea prorocentri]MDA5398462.1 phasin family protein [Hoeflea prorocentri]
MFSFEDANKYGKDAMENMLKSYSAMAQGMQTLTTEATDYSKKSYEDNAAVVEQLFGAKTLEKAFEIQSDHAKSSYEGFVAQATKMSEIYADLARKAYEPYEAAVATPAPAAKKASNAD